MNFRFSAVLAACFMAAGLGLSAGAQAQASGDKSVSTNSVGKADKGGKSYSTT